MDSHLDSHLLAAYRNTNYQVLSSPRVTIRIGEDADGLQALYPDSASFCIITAYNPKSEKVADTINQQQHQHLREYIQSLAGVQVCAETIASDPSKQWPDEHGLLLANLSNEQASDLGQRFKQHAVVWLQQPKLRAELLICGNL